MSELFIKNNPQPIFIYEKESLRFLDINPAALKLYGYSSDEFLQMDLTDLYTSEDIQTLLESSQEIFKDGEFSKPFKHRKKDGSYIYVRISRIEYQYQGSESYLNILEEVSGLFDIEKKKNIFKVAFENTNDMIFITDAEGYISYANDAVYRTLGVSANELINTNITLNCGEEDKNFINDSVFHSHLKETVSFTIDFITSEGRLLETDIVSTPIFDINNKLESFVLIAKSSSRPKVASNESKTDSELLQRSNPDQKPTAVKSNEPAITSTFLSGMFHEILTPMNVILGFTQELIESIESPSPEQKEAVEIIDQNRALILRLMNTIVEYVDLQFNNTESELTEIPITEVIENYEKNLGEITGIRDIEFAYGKISSSLRFNIDKKKFFNLLNNLYRLIGKISQQKKLYFSAYLADNNTFNISISDGFGKSSAQLVETLRSLFIEKKEPKVLGLSKLSIQIIEGLLTSLNGSFTIINENSDKNDAVFRFPLNLIQKEAPADTQVKEKDIPKLIEVKDEVIVEDPQLLKLDDEVLIEEEELEAINIKKEKRPEFNFNEIKESKEVNLAEQEPEKFQISEKTKPIEENKSVEEKVAAPQNKNGLSSLRCLYIEDQVDSQVLFKVQMKDLKNIQFATSFEDALPLLETNDFDFIIMDINLQGEYNGLDALKVIHQIPKFQNIPVIAVTAYVLPGDKEKFIATGFTDFISKPIFRDKLVESLKKIFVN